MTERGKRNKEQGSDEALRAIAKPELMFKHFWDEEARIEAEERRLEEVHNSDYVDNEKGRQFKETVPDPDEPHQEFDPLPPPELPKESANG